MKQRLSLLQHPEDHRELIPEQMPALITKRKVNACVGVGLASAGLVVLRRVGARRHDTRFYRRLSSSHLQSQDPPEFPFDAAVRGVTGICSFALAYVPL